MNILTEISQSEQQLTLTYKQTSIDDGWKLISKNHLHRKKSVSVIYHHFSCPKESKKISACYIAFSKNKPVGCSVVIDNVIHVYVKYYYRKRGVGRALVNIIPGWEKMKGESKFFERLPCGEP